MAKGRPLDVANELLEEFVRSGLVTDYLVSVLSDEVWRAAPPAGRRTIAAIVAHMQSLRRTFARMGGVRPGPPTLDRLTVTREAARRALRQSTSDLAALLESALGDRRARVPGMPRRAVNMLCYLIQHDAHHRGQIVMIAKSLGHEFGPKDGTRLWGWSALPETTETADKPARKPASRRNVKP